MMRKLFVINIIFLFVFFGYTFADMQNNFFCTISSDAITVTLERQNNYKCSQYLKVLSQAINKEYKNVLETQRLIKQGYDVEFWTEIRESKRDKIKKILLIKEQIEKAIQEFDDNLFTKIKEYLIYSTSSYRSKYKTFLKQFNVLDDDVYISSSIKNVVSLIKEQIEVIDNILISEDYEILMKNFNRYVYLKKQIEGK